MSWIKRNLYFLIGGAVAVVLLGVAGYYCYSQWSSNKDSLDKLEAAYADWERISNLNPNPGNSKVDNIKLAREQQREVRGVIARVEKYFAPIAPIPNPANGVVTKEAFASSLRRTIDQLQKEASLGGVVLPPKYDFSFQAERNLPNFAAGSLGPLAAQLGDIKAICGVLFEAKVNSLEAVRRERVSTDDQNGPMADYLDSTHLAVTNEQAVLVPYEVIFQSFSPELAGTLSGFASNPHGIIVKSVNVESGTGAAGADPNAAMTGGYAGDPGMPPAVGMPPMFTPQVPRGYANPAAQPQPAAVRGGLQTVLDEKPLRVTLVLNVVRLLPKK